MADDVPLEDAEKFLSSIGLVTIIWAKTESVLDLIVSVIYSPGGGDKLEAELPRALDRKLTFLRKCYTRLDALKAVQASGIEIVERFHAIKQRRHDLIHGAVSRATADSIEVTILKKDKGKPEGIRMDRETITHDNLIDLLEAITDLLDLTDQHFHAVMAAVFGESFEEAKRRISD